MRGDVGADVGSCGRGDIAKDTRGDGGGETMPGVRDEVCAGRAKELGAGAWAGGCEADGDGEDRRKGLILLFGFCGG